MRNKLVYHIQAYGQVYIMLGLIFMAGVVVGFIAGSYWTRINVIDPGNAAAQLKLEEEIRRDLMDNR